MPVHLSDGRGANGALGALGTAPLGESVAGHVSRANNDRAVRKDAARPL